MIWLYCFIAFVAGIVFMLFICGLGDDEGVILLKMLHRYGIRDIDIAVSGNSNKISFVLVCTDKDELHIQAYFHKGVLDYVDFFGDKDIHCFRNPRGLGYDS